MADEKKTTKDWQKIAEEEPLESPQNADVQDFDATAAQTVSGGILEHPSYKALEDKLTQAELKAHEQWDKTTRAVAELENVRRRAEREIENAHKYGLEKFVSALLPIADSLEQALQCVDAKTDNMQQMTQGIELTLKLLIDALEKFGVKQLNPVGELFNPQLHEAMTTQPDPKVPSGTVLTVFQKGYLLNQRLIRPARVIVAKN